MSDSLLSSKIQSRYPQSADGYVRVRLDDGRVIEEHRVIMAQALGRDLSPGEIVRHIGEDRSDNTVSNLWLDVKGEKGRAHRVSLVCAGCGEPFERAAKLVKLSLKRKQRAFYCSHSCVGRAFGRKKKEPGEALE